MKYIILATLLLAACASPTKLILKGDITEMDAPHALAVLAEHPEAQIVKTDNGYTVFVPERKIHRECRVYQAMSVGEVQILVNQQVQDGWQIVSVGVSEGAVTAPKYLITSCLETVQK